MSPPSSPRHKAPPPPRRLLAVGGAALVTVLTLGGAMGFGPGAAMGKTPPHAATKAAADTSVTDDTDDTSGDTSGTGDGGWLTIDDGPDQQDDTTTGGDNTADETAALPAESGEGARVVFDMTDQRVWLVRANDKVARTYLVSGSLHDNLEPGTYEVYSKSRNAVSFDNLETMNYMVRFAHGERAAIGFHDIPAFDDGSLAQTKADLGTPQSAGCIRQWKPDARALWQFTDVGSTVVVTA